MKFINHIFAIIPVCMILVMSTTALANDPVGRVEQIRGDAQRIGTDGQTASLALGTVIHDGDTISTGDEARVRIRFGDLSSLSMGGGGMMTIDEMVLPSSSSKGKQAMDLVEGVFEFISGNIAKADTRNVEILTPAATIGIRGTQFIFGRLTVGMPEGTSHWGFQIYDGAIDVSSLGGTVTLDEPGEGTFLPIAKVAAPTPVRTWTKEEASEAWGLLEF